MQNEITTEILQGVGKRMRKEYLAGRVKAQKVFECYRHNFKEAEKFSAFGLTIFDFMRLEKETHNPLLRFRLQQCIEEYKAKSRTSIAQNKQSLEKLENYRENALGIGLRKVLSAMKAIVKHGTSIDDEIVLALLETEFANLSAKKLHRQKGIIYQRKTILLKRLADLLAETDWKHGISYKTGKNASSIIYIYLPNGVQLSWHCNEYEMTYYYDEIECEWDGQACLTMEKILGYIHDRYGIGTLVEESVAA